MAEAYLRCAVLNECHHIALACVNDVDYIVLWDFKHMANTNIVKKRRKKDLQSLMAWVRPSYISTFELAQNSSTKLLELLEYL